MADPRFFRRCGPFRLDELAAITGARLAEGVDADHRLCDVAPLDQAGAGELSFLDNKAYLETFERTRAGAVIVEPRFADRAPAGTALLISAAPYKAYALAAQAFYPLERVRRPGLSPQASIDPTAEIGPDCQVDPGAVIEAGARIGARCRIGSNAVVGENVVIGDDCAVGVCASLSHCLIGARVVIYPGARLGQDGFGFARDQSGHVRIPQLGRVIVHDDVEIGANTTIDRGAGPDTIIGPGCMIDNLVQIGHNVQLGRGCVIVGQVGISGSTRVGDFVVLAGQAGIAGHLTIGDHAVVAAKSGVMRDVPSGQTYAGIPAVPVRDWHRRTAMLDGLTKKRR